MSSNYTMNSINRSALKLADALRALLLERRLPWRVQRWLWHYVLSTVEMDGVLLKYRAGTSDMYVIEDIFKRNEYHLDMLNIPPDAIIFDVGAHIGAFTVKMAQLAHRGRIFAFEPMPDNVKVLKKNVAINNFRHVSVFPVGMSGDEEGIKLFVNPGNTAGHTALHKISNSYHQVESISLSKVIQDHHIGRIDLLKMDCEGAEYDTLFNVSKSHLARIKQIIMEYHDHPVCTFEQLAHFLQQAGFNPPVILKSYDAKRGLAYFSRGQ